MIDIIHKNLDGVAEMLESLGKSNAAAMCDDASKKITELENENTLLVETLRSEQAKLITAKNFIRDTRFALRRLLSEMSSQA